MTTAKELAIELGLARFIRLDGSNSASLGHKQRLKHLFVIDFESTCWSERTATTPPPEIIEFPVVLISLETGTVLEEFQEYVMPVERPMLSPFCTELTGITQTMVEGGMPLSTCLHLFSQWMKTVCSTHSISPQLATCCTWSDWDLNLCLENECRRKQVRKPDCLNSWVDIRAVYRQFYTRRPQGLNGALRELGLEFEGREHSGIQDARNTARLVWKMVQDGCKLEVTGSTVDKEELDIIEGEVEEEHQSKKTSRYFKRKRGGYMSKGPAWGRPSGIRIGPPPPSVNPTN